PLPVLSYTLFPYTTLFRSVVPKKVGSGHIVVKIGNDSVVSTGIFNYIYTRTVSTLAGSGKAGFANGQGTDAMFNFSGESWYRSIDRKSTRLNSSHDQISYA